MEYAHGICSMSLPLLVARRCFLPPLCAWGDLSLPEVEAVSPLLTLQRIADCTALLQSNGPKHASMTRRGSTPDTPIAAHLLGPAGALRTVGAAMEPHPPSAARLEQGALCIVAAWRKGLAEQAALLAPRHYDRSPFTLSPAPSRRDSQALILSVSRPCSSCLLASHASRTAATPIEQQSYTQSAKTARRLTVLTYDAGELSWTGCMELGVGEG
jgi:hypothetical protein